MNESHTVTVDASQVTTGEKSHMLNTHILEQVKTAFGNEFIYYVVEFFPLFIWDKSLGYWLSAVTKVKYRWISQILVSYM